MLFQSYTTQDGTLVDLYMSDSLKTRFHDTGQLFGNPWTNGQPGNFTSEYAFDPNDPTRVVEWLIALGNAP